MVTEPPLVPWRTFDINHDSEFARAVRRFNELIADGEKHRWTDISKTILAEHSLKPDTVTSLISRIKYAMNGALRYERGELWRSPDPDDFAAFKLEGDQTLGLTIRQGKSYIGLGLDDLKRLHAALTDHLEIVAGGSDE